MQKNKNKYKKKHKYICIFKTNKKEIAKNVNSRHTKKKSNKLHRNLTFLAHSCSKKVNKNNNQTK